MKNTSSNHLYMELMKKLLGISLVLCFALNSYAQDENKDSVNVMPETYLLDLKGNKVSTEEIKNHGKPFILTFWASWEKKSLLELNNIHEVFKKWHKETGVKVYAISIDDPETYDKVKDYSKKHKWEFQVLIDDKSHFEREFKVKGIPHTMLFDGDRQLIWQKHEYSSGDEEDLHDVLLKLSKKVKVNNEKN